MQEEMINGLIREAADKMLTYHRCNGRKRIKNAVKLLMGRYLPPKDMIFWPTGMLANMLAGWLRDQSDCGIHGELELHVTNALKTYFERWIARGMKLYYIDDVLSGNALLVLYELTGQEEYRAGTAKMAEYLYTQEKSSADRKGSIPYRPAQGNNHIYVDGMGMITSFLLHYGKVCGDDRAYRLGITQLDNMFEYGMCTRTGLPYHGYQYESRKKYGIIGWGRAVGWLLMGSAAAIEFLPRNDDAFERISDYYCKTVKNVLQYQRDNGFFSWQLEAMEGPVDTSATAMIAESIAVGIKSGIFSDNLACYSNVVIKAADSIRSSIQDNSIMNCSGECEGFGRYPQVYGTYPWSQGPGIGLLLAAERINKEDDNYSNGGRIR